MANEENIKDLGFDSRTTEEQREIARKGGIASGKARRKKKAMREQMELLLSLPLVDNKAKAQFKELGIDDANMDNQMALVVSTFKQALKGNTNAINIIRELIGEKVIELNVNNATDSKVQELQEILNDIDE